MNTPASAVVPSREAVEEQINTHHTYRDHEVDPAGTMLLALLAEVERLNTHAERLSRINREVLAESELLSATVADQAALAERDKDAERYLLWKKAYHELNTAIDAALAASVSTQEKPK